MVYRIRFIRNDREFYTAFGPGYPTRKQAKESVERKKRLGMITKYRIVKRKTKGNLRGVKHKHPLSRYKTQTQRGTSKRRKK